MKRTGTSVVALLLLGGSMLVLAQGRPEVASARASESFSAGEDAATQSLRALYVPGGLTSDEAVNRSIRTSPDVERTRALVLEARGGALQAVSGLVPRLDLSAGYTRLSSVPRPEEFPLFLNVYETRATLSYSFTRSLAESLPSYRAAKKSRIAADQQIEAELNDVAFNARQAYYEFARAAAALGVASKTLEEAISQHDETKDLVRAGAAPQVDALRTKSQVSAAEVAVAEAEFGLAVAKRALQTLMHVETTPTLGEDLSLPMTGVPTKPEKVLEQSALSGRPDLRALRTLVRVTEHRLRAARGSAAPDLLLTGLAEYSNPNPRVFPAEDEFQGTWDASAIISWSPNDSVDGAGRAKQLRAELQRAVADVIALEDAIKVEVTEGYHGIFQAEAAWKSSRVGLDAALETYRVRREQLRAGVVNTTDLLQAEAELTRARLEVVDSAVGLRTAKATLLRAIGQRP